jgi:hypothetical protein
MHHEHQGMRLWIAPNEHLAGGTIEPGSDVNLTVGVEPADASNRVQIRYRVNGGPARAIAAEPIRHTGNAQYFRAQLPCAALCDGDTVEYAAVCQCAGRQVPSTDEVERFTSSIRIMSAAGRDNPGSTLISARGMELTPAVASRLDTRHQTIVHGTDRLKPTHLSLFVLERNTGHPIARMPFYAEVGVTSVLPPPKPECRLEGVIRIGIEKFMHPTGTIQRGRISAETLVEPLCDTLSRLLTPDTIALLVRDQTQAASIIGGIIQKGSELAKGRSPDWNNPQSLRQLLEEAIHAYAKEHDLSLAGENVQGQQIVCAHPIGVLATDHVGYLSFDLTRLPLDVADAVALALEARRRNPNAKTHTSIWLYPMAREDARIDALAQMRFAHDAIVVKLELDMELDPVLCQPNLCGALKNLGFMAMQSPSLTDWRLSPASFAVSPSALLGEDGCENLFPANVALQEYYFYQVIGLTDPQVQPPELLAEVKAKVRVGFINEYRLAWYPLGHSLGQIQYSLPLAPGESVNLAIIDWTRRDVGQRTEDTKEAEQLVHNQRRDRTITETVNAAIDEWQRGGSIMGGIAASYGQSKAMGQGALGEGLGISGALGGGYSTSSGSRDITASTVQKLSDNITQASAAMRELQSTVVVQTTQHEKETIETRTVVNYNHSHALTILYYEVLRHFRVVTEFVRRRPVVLAKIDADWLTRPAKPIISDPLQAGLLPAYYQQLYLYQRTILENRATLEAALLDKRHSESFNALERLVHRRNVAEALGPPLLPVNPPPPAGPSLRFFNFDMKVGGREDARTVNVQAKLFGPTAITGYSGEEIKLWDGVPLNAESWTKEAGGQLNPPGSFRDKDANYAFTGRLPGGVPPIPWGAIDAIEINVWLEDAISDKTAVSFQHIRVTGIDVDGKSTILVDKNYREAGFEGDLYMDNVWWIWLPTRRPDPPPPPPPRPGEEIEDEVKVGELLEHLTYHKAHYSRALYLNQNPVERASQLDATKLANDATLLEKVENRPLEIVGDFIAYPCTDPDWANRIENVISQYPPPAVVFHERLVTLPTRGVFAEAKLGHCNASEEIDNTRFWKWEEHPIPHMAPEIAAIQGVTPQPQQQNLALTPFPQSLVNIVNPPAAPDPTGLAGALKVLGTPNIFRDMSGRAEVADLLKKLSDNSVSIAEAATKAREIQTKYGENLDKQQKDYDLGVYKAAADVEGKAVEAQARRAEAEARKAEIEADKAKLDAAKEHMPPPEQKIVRTAIAQKWSGQSKRETPPPPPSGLGFLISFQRVAYGTPGSGSAKIEIKPFGKLKHGATYKPGETIGPPTPDQLTTVPEVYEGKIDDGTIMSRTHHASAPGTVVITAKYTGGPDDFVQVINPAVYDANTNTLTLHGHTDYSQPKSGDIVVLEVLPKFISKKVVAKTGTSAVSELGTEAGGAYAIITAKATGKTGTTSSGENGLEFEVSLLTGGLTITQKNAAKD